MRKLILLALCLLVMFAACKKEEKETKPAEPRRLTIALIPKATTNEFWKCVHAGGARAQRELDVDVIWKGPIKEDDREDQIKVVEDFISRGVDGIVLAPLDDTALRVPVRDAAKAGIPVVIIDSDLNSEDYISFVATNNYQGGVLAGEYLVQALNGQGKVLMLRYLEGSASTSKREQGFLDVIAKHPGITVVSSNQYAGATTEMAYQAAENLLAPIKLPGGSIDLQGIFCPNESTSFGMLRALQESGFAGQVRFVGFDANDKLVEGLRSGEIDALILQSPMNIGYLGVKTMVEHLGGKTIEKRVDTGATVVTKQNMDQPEIHNLIQPDLDKWLK
jgi:ribose transport system substrate-binding protein